MGKSYHDLKPGQGVHIAHVADEDKANAVVIAVKKTKKVRFDRYFLKNTSPETTARVQHLLKKHLSAFAVIDAIQASVKDTGVCMCSSADLTRLFDLDKRTVSKCVQHLQDKDLMRWHTALRGWVFNPEFWCFRGHTKYEKMWNESTKKMNQIQQRAADQQQKRQDQYQKESDQFWIERGYVWVDGEGWVLGEVLEEGV